MAQLGQKAHGFKHLDFLGVLKNATVGFWGRLGFEKCGSTQRRRERRDKRRENTQEVGVRSGGVSDASGGATRRGTKKGSPLGRNRGGCPGMFPAGDGFAGLVGFVWPGGQVVSFGSGWASKMGSFGNLLRRALRRSNSSTARRYMRSDWA